MIFYLLAYFHRLAGLRDPTKTFYIIEMLKGYGKIGCKLDSRLPITLPILVHIMKVSKIVCDSQYTILMFLKGHVCYGIFCFSSYW